MDAFSSPDLVHWTKHPQIIDTSIIPWAKKAMWAPSMAEKDGKYYFFFAANDVQKNSRDGGLGIAVGDQPGGPFKDYLGKPLINQFYHGAQPIDPYVFKDVDGQYYLIYGGQGHCVVGKLNSDFTGLVPFPDGDLVREITPQKYVEGPFMFVRNGKYYFMWSEGQWTNSSYNIAYAIGDSPLGPFTRIGTIIEQNPSIATGAGHHSIIQLPGADSWLIVYHRRPVGDKEGNHRVTCIDRMTFNPDGTIQPVKMTNEGVGSLPVP
jgi:beta-xylosidase